VFLLPAKEYLAVFIELTVVQFVPSYSSVAAVVGSPPKAKPAV
jgi:hypothetical protein